MGDRLLDTWGVQFSASEINSAMFGICENPRLEGIQAQVRARTVLLAQSREEYSHRLLESRLPRFLHFLLDRPKALKRVLRIVPRWRGTMTVVAIRPEDGAPDLTTTREGAEHFAKVWLAEMRDSGSRLPNGGLIFTYTDAEGLPAEVYGESLN